MKRRLYTLDVFTTKQYAGNPLPVITDGDGIAPAKMQAIAREMNLAETVFVQRPTNNGALARLRIFTTTRELPLAGHPVIGTWFLLAESASSRRRKATSKSCSKPAREFCRSNSVFTTAARCESP